MFTNEVLIKHNHEAHHSILVLYNFKILGMPIKSLPFAQQSIFELTNLVDLLKSCGPFKLPVLMNTHQPK